MYSFMVEVRLPEDFTEDFIALIPAQRAFAMQLLQQRRLHSYALAMDRSRLWLTATASSEAEVEEMLSQMPLYPYFEYHLVLLAFSETPIGMLPELSMN